MTAIIGLRESFALLLSISFDFHTLQIKKASAECEDAWKGAGTKVGVQVWRIVKFKVYSLPSETTVVIILLVVSYNSAQLV